MTTSARVLTALSLTGRYDIVFTVNDRPVAWWPMEPAIREDAAPGSGFSRWLREVERSRAHARVTPAAKGSDAHAPLPKQGAKPAPPPTKKPAP